MRKIHVYARSAGVPIADIRWDQPVNQDVSTLVIASGGQEKTYNLSHTDGPPNRGLSRLTISDFDLPAENIVKGWQ